ncbi:30S ribosomal protein S3 [Candidatus Poribacteria bacterium]|nr:30S ribosomal protein S3 [Candidatus Poribacteria bacterium]|tara:strand:+ start:1711 stop:2361 length:651 start_codon:yes stop_codon:yes gene_type:complete
MGQKVNPVGFRLGLTQRHSTQWYTNPNNYASLVDQDYQIRQHIYKSFPDSRIVKIDIQRIADQVRILMYVGRRKKLFDSMDTNNTTPPIEKVRKELNLMLNKTDRLKKVYIRIIHVPKQNAESIMLADWVVDRLKKREPFRRVLRQALQRAQRLGLKGVKVQISGRLNGAEIARTEWGRKGRIPLHTLRADISYCHSTAQTIYGVLGVKVWTYRTK